MSSRSRIPTLLDALLDRVEARFDRRGGAGLRRGGRGRGGVGGKRFDATKLYALSRMSSSHLYDTQVGGGEPGVLSGFGGAMLIRTNAMLAAAQYLVRRNGASTGWQFAIVNSNDMAFYTWPYALASVKLPPAKLGRVMLLIFQQAPTTIRVVQDRFDFTASAAISGYTPEPAARERIGIGGDEVNTGLNPEQLAHIRWQGTPTDTHFLALADLIRTLGDVPTKAAMDAIFQAPVTDADVATLAPVHWYDAASVTPSGANLLSMTNLGSAGGTINVGAGTVLLPTADASLDGKPSITLDGVNHYLTSSLPASAWRFLHDGTGGEVFCVFVPNSLPTNQVYWATGAAGNGAGAAMYTSNTLISYLIQNGAGTTALLANLGTLSIGTPVYTDSTFGLSETPDMVNRLKSVPVSNGVDITLTPAAGDSLSTLRIGANYAGGQRCSMRLAAFIAFNRVLTPSQRATMQQYFATRYGLDRATTTHRWSLRDVLAKGRAVSSGQVSPAALPDSVTAASVDAMARTGSPTVAVIDPSIDGRKTYGVLGLGDANYLEAPIGIRGAATGFTLLFTVRFDAAASGSVVLISNYVGTPTGFTVYTNSSQIRIYRAGSADLVIGTAATADIGVTKLVGVTWDGTTWRAYEHGAAGATAVNTMVYGVSPMRIGTYLTGSGGGTGFSSVFAVAGCDAALTPAEITAAYNTWRATGRIEIPSGKPNAHGWDITQDIAANGGPANGVPAIVLDRIGSDHLVKTSGLAVVSNGAATGLRNFVAATNILATPAGMAGAAGGFWASVLVAPQTLTGVRILFGKSNHGAAGWAIGINGAYIVTYISDGGVNTAGPQLNMGAGAGYLNTPTHIAMVLSAGTLTLYVNGAAVGTPLAVTTYNPGTTSMVIGATNGGVLYAAAGVDIFGAAGGHFVPTAGELATASADSLSSGSIAAVPAKTSHRYDLKADIVDAGGAVPTRALERTSGVDTMTVVNAKLEVAQRAERLWSYETSPILLGAEGFTLADYLETIINALPGHASGFTVSWFGAITSQAVASTTRRLFSQRYGNNPGWEMSTTGTNGSASFGVGGSSAATSPTATIAAADVGKLHLFTGVWDGPATTVRLYAKRIQVAGGSSLPTGYLPDTTVKAMIGRRDGPVPGVADGVAAYGVAYALGVPTLAQIQAQFDAVAASERIQLVPGLPGVCIDLTQDITGNGGAMPAVFVDRGTGGVNFSRAGAPAVRAHFARAFSW